MNDIDARLEALLGSPERTVQTKQEVPGLLQEVTPEQLHTTTTNLIAVQAAGEALKQARQYRELSLRGAAKASGRSAPRVLAMEETGTDIMLSTIVEHAGALGYNVTLTLTPTNGDGPQIKAELTHEESVSDASVVRGEVRLKPKTRVKK